jgi:hypothetical protein
MLLLFDLGGSTMTICDVKSTCEILSALFAFGAAIFWLYASWISRGSFLATPMRAADRHSRNNNLEQRKPMRHKRPRSPLYRACSFKTRSSSIVRLIARRWRALRWRGLTGTRQQRATRTFGGRVLIKSVTDD